MKSSILASYTILRLGRPDPSGHTMVLGSTHNDRVPVIFEERLPTFSDGNTILSQAMLSSVAHLTSFEYFTIPNKDCTWRWKKSKTQY